MKCTHFFFLFFLLPTLVFSYFQEKDADKIEGKIQNLWKSHEELLGQFGIYSLEEQLQHLDLLHKSIECCQKAVSYYDKILKEISYKPKKTRQAPPWPEVKKRCEQIRAVINVEVDRLQNLVQTVEREGGVFIQVKALYEQAQQKASLAVVKVESFPRADLDNLEKMVPALLEIANLYEEAASYSRQALHLLSASSDEQSKNVLVETIGAYEHQANYHRKQADELQQPVQP
jgi:tetratricopeptide (TPR) repeat protein